MFKTVYIPVYTDVYKTEYLYPCLSPSTSTRVEDLGPQPVYKTEDLRPCMYNNMNKTDSIRAPSH